MNELKQLEKIQELERQITGLPIGYISKKTINGKVRYYHQWTENRKKHSQYLRDGEMEVLQEQIDRRKSLQAQLKELQSGMPKARQPKLDFETSVIAGRGLEAMSRGVKDWGLRDCFEQLEEYLYSKESDRVCLIFGLRRTGKTTMLRQAIGRMAKEDLSRTAYIKARRTDNMAMMNRDLKKLFNAGFRYVFIDEVTLMEDFIDSAALFSDVFATMGMKIVLSGTDSLGFWLAMDEELYDRAKSIHTTFIPYREYIVLLETMKAADKDHRVFKLQFEAGEFDMVIYDQKENSCEIFEIKHSSKQVPLQYRHLVDEDKCQRTERRFGPIQGRYILYRGEDAQMENGVQYWNVENYLKALPTLDIVQVQEIGMQSIEPTL